MAKILSLSNLNRFLVNLKKIFATAEDLTNATSALQIQIDDSAEAASTALSTANAASSTASTASSKATTAASNASTALSTANANADFIAEYFTETSSGLTIEADNSVILQGTSTYGLLNVGSMVSVDGSHNDFALKRTGALSIDGYYHAWYPLYQNSSGTTGTVSLALSAAKFDYILVIYKDSEDYQSSSIAFKNSSSSSVWASLTSSYGKTGMFVETKNITIGTTSITNYTGGRIYVAEGGSTVNSAISTSNISILAVFGLHM